MISTTLSYSKRTLFPPGYCQLLACFLEGRSPAEYEMIHPGPTEVVPMFAPQLRGEPVPQNGRIKLSALDKPGFGVELNRDIPMHCPYTH